MSKVFDHMLFIVLAVVNRASIDIWRLQERKRDVTASGGLSL